MKIFLFSIFIIGLVTIISPVEIFAETALDVYMNDFYSKSNEASKILKEIEKTINFFLNLFEVNPLFFVLDLQY